MGPSVQAASLDVMVQWAPDRRMRRTLVSIALAGTAGALLVFAAGAAIQRVVIGADNTQARSRVEAEVRTSFATMSQELRDMAARLADPAAIRAASAGDRAAARDLIARAVQVVAAEERNAALTVYSDKDRPVAWTGHPSELSSERLARREAWFLAPAEPGLRLVYVRPVVEGTATVGSIAVERPLPPAEATSDANEGSDLDYRIDTSLAPVSIQLPQVALENATVDPTRLRFAVHAPSGQLLLTAIVSDSDLIATRENWSAATLSISTVVLAITLVLLTGPLLDWRNRARNPRTYGLAVAVIAIVLITARLMLSAAALGDWSSSLAGVDYASGTLPLLLQSPLDFLLTAAAACALVALLLGAVEATRGWFWRGRRSVSVARGIAFLLEQLAAGGVVAYVLVKYQAMLQDTVISTSFDLLHLSIHPWDPTRLLLQLGLVLAHTAAMGLCVLVLRAGLVGWRVPRRKTSVRLLTLAAWTAPLVIWQLTRATPISPQMPLLVAVVATAVVAGSATRVASRFRRGAQTYRLALLTLPLLIPSFSFYPTIVQFAREAKAQLVVTDYAKEVMEQRDQVQARTRASQAEIDAIPGLEALVATKVAPTETFARRAFSVWQKTGLSAVTSAVELYGPDRRLVSRYSFNLPEDLASTQPSAEGSCSWDMFDEVARVFGEERRLLHSGRALCAPGEKFVDEKHPARGSIVVHAMPDYENLSFTSRSPYRELTRRDQGTGEGSRGEGVEFAVYGWSRTPLYSSVATAWSLPDDVFARVQESRTPFWTTLTRGPDVYEVYVLNDRAAIYALGFPVISALGHLVNLAELALLALCVYLLILAASRLYRWLSRRQVTGHALFREVRASFYHKLFVAFVLAVFFPVVALVLVTRNYVAGQMERTVELEALRTAAAAGRVVQDLAAARGVDDNTMVQVRELIDQDVNMFMGPELQATSERNLFESGLLPVRTPWEVYDALELRNEGTFVTRERIRTSEYLVAALSLSVRQLGVVTVPMTARQREIDQQIATLDRRALLAALLFVLAGAGLGYSMAERISDPVNRLTRATRRISRGDLDARIMVTSSDELRRLVEAFNSMANDLKRQRSELERTHRLEAWAEMARQVAHEIKNPLTPIQLNAEHLRRVHADRGEPLSPVLQECVATILTQVKLLRQIASEFSSYASSPTAKPADVDIAALLREIVEPYRTGLEGRIRFTIDVPSTLPPVYVDRTLIARSLTNIVENALHAMPGAGTLTVSARHDGRAVQISVSDTGVGMDPEALARVFEPYFSTKASGTGLGLPIAKRNVELSGGTITIASERDRGTTVTITLPVAGSLA